MTIFSSANIANLFLKNSILFISLPMNDGSGLVTSSPTKASSHWGAEAVSGPSFVVTVYDVPSNSVNLKLPSAVLIRTIGIVSLFNLIVLPGLAHSSHVPSQSIKVPLAFSLPKNITK